MKIPSACEEAGMHMLAARDGGQVFITGHPEHDRLTLKTEYHRDVRVC